MVFILLTNYSSFVHLFSFHLLFMWRFHVPLVRNPWFLRNTSAGKVGNKHNEEISRRHLALTIESSLATASEKRNSNAISVSWKKHLTSLVTNRLFSTKALASGVQWYFGFGIKKKAPASVSTLEDTTSYNTTLGIKARQPETWEEGPGRLRNGATQTATYIFLHGGFSHSRCLPQSFNPHFCRRLSSNCSARKCKSSFPTGSACHKFTQRCMRTPRNGEAALPQNHSGAFTLLAIGAPTSSAQRNWSARRA